MVFWISVTIIVVGSVLITEVTDYKKKKLVEDHKTNNLALAYQILSARPEATLEDVQALIDENSKQLRLTEKNKTE